MSRKVRQKSPPRLALVHRCLFPETEVDQLTKFGHPKACNIKGITISSISKPMVCQTYGLHVGCLSRKRRKSQKQRKMQTTQTATSKESSAGLAEIIQKFRKGVGGQRGLARGNPSKAGDSGLFSVPFFLCPLRRRDTFLKNCLALFGGFVCRQPPPANPFSKRLKIHGTTEMMKATGIRGANHGLSGTHVLRHQSPYTVLRTQCRGRFRWTGRAICIFFPFFREIRPGGSQGSVRGKTT